MKSYYGALEFRYDCFGVFAERLQREGSYSVNLGDNIQGLAVRDLFASFGVRDADVRAVNRDNLPAYDGPPVRLVTNAMFLSKNFPIPAQVTPVFIGLHVEADVIRERADYFRRHQPIGCRDTVTRDLFRAEGIDAYTSGCLTLTFPKRTREPERPKLFFVYGDLGPPPEELVSRVPGALRENAEHVFQRMSVNVFPLGAGEVARGDAEARRLLQRYRDEATLVVTPLLHAASPCIAMGIPVIVARTDRNARFSALGAITPVHSPGDFDRIDWNPPPVDADEIRYHLTELLKCLLEAGVCKRFNANRLDEIFSSAALSRRETPSA